MKYYVGWDVGGWACKSSRKSKDALHILFEDANREDCIPFRNSLSDMILNNDNNPLELIKTMLQAAGNRKQLLANDEVIFAVDAILGMPRAFRELIDNGKNIPSLNYEMVKNPYLFRETEKQLFKYIPKEIDDQGRAKKRPPLSLLKDRLGSQTTKMLHFMNKIGLKQSECGLFWESNVSGVKVILFETYPRAITLEQAQNFLNDDLRDAFKCAVVARMFNKKMDGFYPVEMDNWDKREGWIWQPNKSVK